MSDEPAFALLCRTGFVHTEHDTVPTGETYQCAADAADFMDQPDSQWSCGPHTVTEVSRSAVSP
jgi:hypothetical protein